MIFSVLTSLCCTRYSFFFCERVFSGVGVFASHCRSLTRGQTLQDFSPDLSLSSSFSCRANKLLLVIWSVLLAQFVKGKLAISLNSLSFAHVCFDVSCWKHYVDSLVIVFLQILFKSSWLFICSWWNRKEKKRKISVRWLWIDSKGYLTA